MSTNSTNESHCANVVEGRPIEFYIFGLLIPDIVSSMANLMVTYIFYYTVEISHPQFMIIFQNHCLGNVINVLSLVLHIFYSAIQSVPCFSTVYILLNYNALQFNFISWLCVAIMRWYFISKADDNIVMNFPIMKTFALAFVWIFFISIKVCNNIVVQLCTIFITRLVFYSLMVLPVVLCILMYFALKIQLAKKEQLEMLQHQNRMKSNPPQNELEDQLEQVGDGFFFFYIFAFTFFFSRVSKKKSKIESNLTTLQL